VSEEDDVDLIIDAWAAEWPDIDFTPLDVFARLRRMSRIVDILRQDVLKNVGLTPWEFIVLSFLHRSSQPLKTHLTDIVNATLLTSGTVSQHVSSLAGRGLIDKSTDTVDKRRALIVLTPAGHELVTEAMLNLVEAERALLETLPPELQADLAEGLRRLVAEGRGEIAAAAQV